MQVIVDAYYIELLRENNESKRESGEYSPFAGRRVPVVSMEDVKRLMSLQKDMGQELLTQPNCNYSKR